MRPCSSLVLALTMALGSGCTTWNHCPLCRGFDSPGAKHAQKHTVAKTTASKPRTARSTGDDARTEPMLKRASYTTAETRRDANGSANHIPPAPSATRGPVPAEPDFSAAQGTAATLPAELTDPDATATIASDGPQLIGSPQSAADADYAHAEDYTWVQGKLFKVYSGGGYWQVRYAPLDQIDEHGGNFVLTGRVADDLRDGDIVRIEGRVLNYDRRLAGTRYEVHGMQVIRQSDSSF